MTPRARRAVLVAFLLLLPLVRVAFTYRTFSHVLDEPFHVAAGYEWLRRGTYDLEREHPPLARVLFALPAWLSRDPIPASGDAVELGNAIFYRNDRYVANLAAARAPNLLFLLITLIAAALWSRKIAGDRAAIGTLIILGALPPILGHAGVATTDMPVTAMLTLSLYLFTLWLERRTWPLGIATAVCIGLGLLTKMSFLVYFPIAAAVLLYRHRPRVSQLIAGAIVIAVIVWTGYRFHTGRLNDYRLTTFPSDTPEYQAASYARSPGYEWVRADILRRYWTFTHGIGSTTIDFCDWAKTAGYPSPKAGRYGNTMRNAPPVPPLRGTAALLEPLRASGQWIAIHVPLPAPEFIAGAEYLQHHTASGHSAFLLGRHSDKGWWYYFPVVLFFKTPLALLVLALMRPRQLLIPALMLAVAMTSSINIGVRHVLPMYPFLAIAASVAVVSIRRTAAIVLCGWYLAATTLAHPDYLSYFNECALGHPERIATDSNLDWGQDLLRLGDYARQHNPRPLYVAYFGTAEWRRHVPNALELPAGRRVSGWIALSDMRRGEFPWLADEKPVDRVGASIRIYHVP